VSNRVNIAEQDEVRVLLTTDVLSEGQNLQDAAIVVNFDLPWAIIRLSQRAGRVDRIGQQAEVIRCYSFLPQDGVEQLINLRARVSQRLRDNGEVIGSDERFFEDQAAATALHDLYTERASVLDGRDSDDDTDLASYAKGIWDKATQHNPSLKDSIEKMPDVVYSAREYIGSVERPQGVLVYIKTRDGYDALEWVDRDGQSVTQSQRAILYASECRPETPAIERQADHHDRVREAIERIQESFQPGTAGALGGPTSVRRKVYERLETYIKGMKSKMPLWMTPEVSKRLQDIQQHVFTYPLTETARNGLGRQLRAGINDDDFVTVLGNYYDDSNLVVIPKEGDDIEAEPHIVCSLGLHAL
jgi:hypothetical protein